MSDVKISRRGVYYDLNLSPYEYITPYGDIFKFSSKKKLEIYTRDITKELNRIESMFKRNKLYKFIPDEVIELIKRKSYVAFYNCVEG